MSRVSIYLNFAGKTEEAFNFYKSVFGTEFATDIQRMKDVPADPSRPPLKEEEKEMVMHVELPILSGLALMGTDTLESMGQKLVFGNNISINLEPDTRAETDKLYKAIAQDGKQDMPLGEMFWGGYFGMVTDKFGVQWMFNCSEAVGEVA